jgi:hypothetical protein
MFQVSVLVHLVLLPFGPVARYNEWQRKTALLMPHRAKSHCKEIEKFSFHLHRYLWKASNYQKGKVGTGFWGYLGMSASGFVL